MSFDPNFLKIPISGINIGGNDYVFVVRECSISRTMNEHDSVTMSATLAGNVSFGNQIAVPINIQNPTGETRTISIEQLAGQPIRFIMGVDPDVSFFAGYVTSVNPTNRFKQGIDFEIEMSGASIVLQQSNRYFDNDARFFDLIKKRTESSELTLFCDNHPYVFPTTGQTEESDWEFILALSNLIGYTVFTWGPVIRVCNPYKILATAPKKRLVFSDNVLDTEKSLMDLYIEEVSPDLWRTQEVEAYCFDTLGSVLQFPEPATRNANRKYNPVGNVYADEGGYRMAVESVSKQIERWRFNATARIKGDTGIYPGMMVQLDTGQQSATTTYNGNWLVTGVEHSMNRTAFDTNLTLTRPAVRPNQTGSTFQHFWSDFNSAEPRIILRTGGALGKHWVTQFGSISREV